VSGLTSRDRGDQPNVPSARSSQAALLPAAVRAHAVCVSGWLDSHGFGAYANAFAAHKVDSMDMLVLLSRSDLRHVTGVVGDAVRLHEVVRVKGALLASPGAG